MYRKALKGWLKHWDFMLLDSVCLQVAFLLAYMLRHGVDNPYARPIYRNEAVILVLIQVLVTFFSNNFKNVLKRGIYNEFVATLKQAVLVSLFSVFYLFLIQEGADYSRMTLLFTGMFYLIISYIVRLVWKKLLQEKLKYQKGKRSLIIITVQNKAEELIHSLRANNYGGLNLNGVVVMDKDCVGDDIAGIKVVANRDTVTTYICRQWVDEVFLDMDNENIALEDILRALEEMGVTVHLRLDSIDALGERKQYVEKIGGYKVLTASVNVVSYRQMFYKRMLDILGSIVGCLITGVLFLFVAPAIYIKSPGPVFFSQVRVGQNGKRFKMYKFRSMYMDAEERKKELLAQNRIKDGLMFKIEDDPRIIKGIGHFIRKTSIDEFPQFFNVLKGDMSLVGTRPPTVDEWEKYELHHRVRLAIKPGITGLWQISGRSSITDFEEVVKLDQKYIEEWNIGKDIKILLKTIGVVVRSGGAM